MNISHFKTRCNTYIPLQQSKMLNFIFNKKLIGALLFFTARNKSGAYSRATQHLVLTKNVTMLTRACACPRACPT